MDVPILAREVNPKYLHSNSTSHAWAFSAIAELIDNAYDPDVKASRLDIKYESLEKHPCLTFTDDGNGLDTKGMHCMLSFGFSEKADKGKHKAIGQYGNGFKSGSMRLGKDAVVFSKKGNNRTIGFLSQTYLKRIGATTVLTPIVTWQIDNIPPKREEDPSLNAIMEYSLFFSLGKLLEQFDEINGHQGTRIVIYNLKRDTFQRIEFDLMIDEHDIVLMNEYTPIYPADDKPAYKYSLRAYCEILYLNTLLRIYIRGRKVQRKVFEETVCKTEKMTYKPTSVKTPVDIYFGFKIEQDKKHKADNEYGIMLYNNGRLIKPFVKVGYQTRPDERGVDVLGMMECNFIRPTHNKQDFLDDSMYRSLLKALGTKLNSFWDLNITNRHIPAEVLARGLVSLTAYKKALQSGKKAVYRTRLMFVGQERVGKTSLKKRLLGKRFDPQESITDGIDTSNTCHVSVEQVRNWNVDLSQGDVHVQALAECMAKDLRTVENKVKTSQPTQPNTSKRKVTHGAAKTVTVTNPSVSKERMAKDLRTVDTTVETSQPILLNQRTHGATKTETVTIATARKVM